MNLIMQMICSLFLQLAMTLLFLCCLSTYLTLSAGFHHPRSRHLLGDLLLLLSNYMSLVFFFARSSCLNDRGSIYAAGVAAAASAGAGFCAPAFGGRAKWNGVQHIALGSCLLLLSLTSTSSSSSSTSSAFTVRSRTARESSSTTSEGSTLVETRRTGCRRRPSSTSDLEPVRICSRQLTSLVATGIVVLRVWVCRSVSLSTEAASRSASEAASSSPTTSTSLTALRSLRRVHSASCF